MERPDKESEVRRVSDKELNNIADQIIEILKAKKLTVKIAWKVINTVREKLHDFAYEKELD